MTLKCDVILIIIFFIIGAGGGFSLGYVSAPKEITNIQNIEQTQIQTQAQGQVTVTVAGGRELQSVQVQLDSLTNITVLTVTNGVTNKLQ
ncbi:MAG: hypothetical protein HPY53_04870 [Brevinematales bacterium]|nr:hypothetical protein [Brevinematales bacterium]